MDRFKGKRFAYYPVDEIVRFISEDLDKFESKNGWESLAGCILAKCDEKNINELPIVGYMLKGTYSETDNTPKPELSEIFGSNLIEDRDVDIWVQHKESFYGVQITRLENYGAGDDANIALLDLIKKKSCIPQDPKLQLIILMDYEFKLKLNVLVDTLPNMKIPYGRIILIGQIKKDGQFGEFRCREVFPEDHYTDVKL